MHKSCYIHFSSRKKFFLLQHVLSITCYYLWHNIYICKSSVKKTSVRQGLLVHRWNYSYTTIFLLGENNYLLGQLVLHQVEVPDQVSSPLQGLNMPQVATEPSKVLPDVIKQPFLLAIYLNCWDGRFALNSCSISSSQSKISNVRIYASPGTGLFLLFVTPQRMLLYLKPRHWLQA